MTGMPLVESVKSKSKQALDKTMPFLDGGFYGGAGASKAVGERLFCWVLLGAARLLASPGHWCCPTLPPLLELLLVVICPKLIICPPCAPPSVTRGQENRLATRGSKD